MKRSMVIAVVVGIAVRGLASPWYVAPSGDDGNDGTSWLLAKETIQAGVDAASGANAVVYVTNATYLLSSEVDINKAVTLVSWNNGHQDPTNTVLDGQETTACLYIRNAGAVVSGFTVTNGNGIGGANPSHGGGVYMTSGTLTNCVVAGNTANLQGGGIYASGTGSLIVDCDIIGNIQTNTSTDYSGGGGVYFHNGPQLLNSRILHNKSMLVLYYSGGGGVDGRYAAQVIGCTISYNESSTQGGGINLRDPGSSTVIVSNEISYNNLATSTSGYRCGGGVGLRSPRIGFVMDSCQIIGNTCSGWGSAIGVQDGGETDTYGFVITNCTIRANSGAGWAIGRSWGGGAGSTNAAYEYRMYDTVWEANTNTSTHPTYRNGGAIGFNYAGMWIENCTIRANEAYGYAGVYYAGINNHRPFVLRNCLIADNVAQTDNGGGGIIRAKGWVESCTIAGNEAAGSYGGLYIADGGAVTNTICYFNTAGGSHPDWHPAGAAELAYNCFSTNDPARWPTVITNMPGFVNRGVGDYRLGTATSGGVDAGLNQPWMQGAFDLSGRPRIIGAQVDMGAYEFWPSGTLFIVR